MALIMLRHATAVDERYDLADDDRYLTADGRATAYAAGLAMRAKLEGNIVVFTSPLVRAVQTAELALAPLGVVIASLELLRPNGSPKQAHAELARALTQADHVVAVGHEPSISALVAIALGLSHHRALGRAEAIAVHAQRVAWQLTP